MCPLRLILVFLSATLAGFFVLRNFRSQPKIDDEDDADTTLPSDPKISDSSNENSKVDPFFPFASIFIKNNFLKLTLNLWFQVRVALESGFWTFVDMASGRYLWRHVVSSSSKRSSWWCFLCGWIWVIDQYHWLWYCDFWVNLHAL